MRGPLWMCAIAMLSALNAWNAFAATPVPELNRWESQMVQYGAKWCNELSDPNTDGGKKLSDTYYDAARVYFQIADYTRDSRWLGCVAAAQSAYRDGYVLNNNGAIPGYWIFPHGIYMDLKRTGNSQDRTALFALADRASYAAPGTYPVSWVQPADHAREIAYNLMLHYLAVDAGNGQQGEISYFVELLFGHFDQWFVSRTAPFMQPFMVGLGCEALITHYNYTRDSRVLPTIQRAMDDIWANMWVPSAESFLYINAAVDSEGGAGAIAPAPDLNMLIAPAYAWLFLQTGDVKYRDRGDAIWAGAVRRAAVDWAAKQYNQSYRWSFDYLKWRAQAEGTLPPDAQTPTGGGGAGWTPSGVSAPSSAGAPELGTSSNGKPRNFRKR
jgi:hypothetical protein